MNFLMPGEFQLSWRMSVLDRRIETESVVTAMQCPASLLNGQHMTQSYLFDLGTNPDCQLPPTLVDMVFCRALWFSHVSNSV
jgi:hypothetical protein